jgi:hypothetical protein
MKSIYTKILFLGWLLMSVWSVQAQGGDQLGVVRSAIAGGSSRDLAQYLAPSVEVSFDGESQSYNANQTELVMRNFFAKNSPNSFEIVHQGASNDGIPYAVGRYVGRTGTYQVFLKLKPKRSSPMIDTMNFTKE